MMLKYLQQLRHCSPSKWTNFGSSWTLQRDQDKFSPRSRSKHLERSQQMNDNLGMADGQFDSTLGSLKHQRRHETFISSAFDARELEVFTSVQSTDTGKKVSTNCHDATSNHVPFFPNDIFESSNQPEFRLSSFQLHPRLDLRVQTILRTLRWTNGLGTYNIYDLNQFFIGSRNYSDAPRG